MELNLHQIGSDTSNTISVADEIFDVKYNEPLIHQVVTAYLAAARAGTHAQKTRAEVNGGKHKPWRQKGTGRARAGTTRSPLWRGGGVTFASKTRDYSQKVNKKMYRAALRSIFSELIRTERLHLLESIQLEKPKTKDFLSVMKSLNIDNALVITADDNENLYLAARNLYDFTVMSAARVDPVSLISYEKVVVTAEALKAVEGRIV